MSSKYDWTSFTVRINVRAPMEDVYNAWASRTGIEHWFLRESIFKDGSGNILSGGSFVQAGNTYTWRWYGYPDEVVETGEITLANGKDQFAFSFGKAGHCKVILYEEHNELIVQLDQTNIPDDEESRFQFHIGCKTGWTFYLANLKSMLEGGIDLRNRNTDLQEMLNS